MDSNILIYLHSKETDKRLAVQNLLATHHDFYISTQVLFEFANVMHKKFKIDYAMLKIAIQDFNNAFNIETITYATMVKSLEVATRYKYSLPDSLIVATALQCDSVALVTEDMHSGQQIAESLQIINPFML